jgi:hypothetical protein
LWGKAVAHYLWPPLWIGSVPKWIDDPKRPIEPGDLGAVIVDAQLPEGLRFYAYRDGMLVFEFPRPNSAPGPTIKLDAEEGFGLWADRKIGWVRLMNAHLACLHTAAAGRAVKATVLTPSRLFSVDPRDGNLLGGSGDLISHFELWRARTEKLPLNDWRLLRSPAPVTTEAVERSLDLFRQMLEHSTPNVLLRAELLFRSAAAYQDHDHSAALVNAWTATEGLLRDRYAEYLDACADRPVDEGRTFINARRRKFLEGSEVTARLMAEILSLADRLPFPLYQEILEGSKVRNNWLHKQEQVSPADAEGAINAAQYLFELTEGITLNLPLRREISLP